MRTKKQLEKIEVENIFEKIKSQTKKEWQCDGVIDCQEHGEDESLEFCGRDHIQNHPCRTGVYCNNQCVTFHVCDGVKVNWAEFFCFEILFFFSFSDF